MSLAIANQLRSDELKVREVSNLDKLADALKRTERVVIPADDGAFLRAAVASLVPLCGRLKRTFKVTIITAELGWDELEKDLPEAFSRAVELRILSLPSRAARQLLTRYPLHCGADVVFGQSLHLLLIGFAQQGQAIARHIMQLAHYGDGKAVITVMPQRGDPTLKDFLRDFPQAEQAGQLRTLTWGDFRQLDVPPVTAVYITMDDSAAAVNQAHQLIRQLAETGHTSPLFFLQLETFQPSHQVSRWDGQLIPFSALQLCCQSAVLFSDRDDALAAEIHNYYQDSTASQGRNLENTPAGEPWERLSESYRQASRYQADHAAAKLASIDCRAVPEERAEFFYFGLLEAEKLAIIEHDRWSADRYLDGWVYGKVRDNDRKHHPELKPYSDLTVKMKDLDRYAVRLMPALLARQGMAIQRDLLVAVAVETIGPIAERWFKQAIDRVLQRICARYPDRALVIALDPSNRHARIVARCARAHYGAELRSVMSGVIQKLLEQLTPTARSDFLELLAVTEQRIFFADSTALAQWLASRPALLIEVSSAEERLAACPDTSNIGGLIPPRAAKIVRLNPVNRTTEWSFEY